MNYPCGIIEDLLPLYIDDVCNEESKQAVHNHLTDCEKCRNCYEAMKSTDGVTGKRKSNSEDNIIANSLKNVKKRINRKIRNLVLCATAAVLIVMYGFSLLFNIPIKNISPADISVTAHVYPLSEIIDNSTNDVTKSDMVTIFSDENDRSEKIKVNIPGIGMVVLTKDTIEKCQAGSSSAGKGNAESISQLPAFPSIALFAALTVCASERCILPSVCFCADGAMKDCFVLAWWFLSCPPRRIIIITHFLGTFFR